jgi:hypothetical protein
MEAGIELARWFADEAARVYGELGGCLDSSGARFDREQRRLISWIRRKGGRVTARDLTLGPRRFRGKGGSEHAENALEVLVASGAGSWENVGGDDRGRPTRVFVLDDVHDENLNLQTAIVGDGDENQLFTGSEAYSSPSPPQIVAIEDDARTEGTVYDPAHSEGGNGNEISRKPEENGFSTPSPPAIEAESEDESRRQEGWAEV